MFDNCPECSDLWHRFAHATSENFSVEDQLRRALQDQDRRTVRALQRHAKILSDRKMQLREAIRKHDADIHGVLPGRS